MINVLRNEYFDIGRSGDMRKEKRVVHNGNTFILRNVVPDMTYSKRKLIIQEMANELASIFMRGR